jgi:hypothetical protein
MSSSQPFWAARHRDLQTGMGLLEALDAISKEFFFKNNRTEKKTLPWPTKIFGDVLAGRERLLQDGTNRGIDSAE